MDPLTHTATGLFLSRAGLKSWTPLATPILLIAANAPDIDIVTAAGGSLNYLHFHRHLTHALVAVPVIALGSVALIRLIARKPVRWIGAFAAAAIGVLSHLLLDLTNAYGVRLLMPFSARWLRLDLLNVFDLWIWAAFLLALAAPFIGRLVGAEIASGGQPSRHHGRGFAWFALVFFLLYAGGRAALHERAVAIVDSRIYQGIAPARSIAVPSAGNPWSWSAVVETSEFYAVENLDLRADFDPARAVIFHKPDPDPAIDAARDTETFRRFLEFSQFPLWRVSPASEPENARLVEVFDMRFGSPPDTAFMASAIVSARREVLETDFHFRGPGRR